MTTKRKTTKSSKAARKSRSAGKKADRASKHTGPTKYEEERVEFMSESPLAVTTSDKNLQAMLSVVRDQNTPPDIRLKALQSLQAASFSVVAFESCRSDYIATLRDIADDPNLDIRKRVLGILAREKDGYAQKKLLEGLEKPEKALVPPEKALQLLSYDVHADAYSAAREIVQRPPNPTAKREALRLLSADAKSAPIFEKILRDKDELRENRQISASALQSLKPEKLQEHARDMLMDKKEYDDIQATSLTAITQFGDEESVSRDEKLMESVDRMSDKGSTKVKKGARRFLNRYRR